MNETTREHLEFHLRRLKGARAAAAELSLKPRSGALDLLIQTHFAILALEAVLADSLEAEHSALAEVAADLGRPSPRPSPAAVPAQTTDPADADAVAAWWRASLAPLNALAEATRRR
jgi:hypothetical protein